MGLTETLKWKISAIAGCALMLAAGVALLLGYAENRHLQKVTRNQDALINAPGTGYVARLAQSETNTVQLKTAIETQRKQFEAKAAADAAVLSETARRLAAAQVLTRRAQAGAAKILATPPQGDTLDARIRDVDARLLETM
jgi:hypothetical protein